MGQSKAINTLHPSIPRVLCPRCGKAMRLAEINPDQFGREIMRFDCACAFEFRMLHNVQNEWAA
jgi:hypothetical protein